MSRPKRYLQRKAIERAPAPALEMVGKAVLKGVDRAVVERWDRALRMAEEAEGETPEERVRSVAKRFRRELAAMGAASGAVAAAPGLGTGAAASALVADLGWFSVRSTDLIMTIGAVHGHVDSTLEERRAWVLSILAFGEDAASEFATLVHQVDAGVTIGGERVSARLAGMAGGDVAKLDALRRINTSLATTVISKYGSRRSALAIGKLLPFGVGAVVGGTANYALIRVVGTQAARFFSGYNALLPPPPQPGQARLGTQPPGLPHTSGLPQAAIAQDGQAHDSVPSGSQEPKSAGGPPPPLADSRPLPNPPARLSKKDRRNSVATDGTEK